MRELDALCKRVKRINVIALRDEAILRNKEKLTELNKAQLRKGRTAKGQEITPGLKSVRYARAKKSRGGKAPMGTPDLKFTGSFQALMFFRLSGREYEFSSIDGKTEMLFNKYGEDIFGLDLINRGKAKRMNTRTFSLLWRRRAKL